MNGKLLLSIVRLHLIPITIFFVNDLQFLDKWNQICEGFPEEEKNNSRVLLMFARGVMVGIRSSFLIVNKVAPLV